MGIVLIGLIIWAPQVILWFLLAVVTVVIFSVVTDAISGIFTPGKPSEIKPLPFQKDRRLICNKPIYYHHNAK